MSTKPRCAPNSGDGLPSHLLPFPMKSGCRKSLEDLEFVLCDRLRSRLPGAMKEPKPEHFGKNTIVVGVVVVIVVVATVRVVAVVVLV